MLNRASVRNTQAESPNAQQFHRAYISVPLEDEDAALTAIVSRYPTLQTILPTLREWTQQGHYDAVSELTQVALKMPEVNAEEAWGYFGVMASLPEHYGHQCASYLATRLTPDVATRCYEAFCAETSFNENQARAWAIAITHSDPASALDMVTPGSGIHASLLRLIVLEFVQIGQKAVAEAILNQEEAQVAFLLGLTKEPAFALRAWAILARIASISGLAEVAVCDAMAQGCLEAIHGRAGSVLSRRAVNTLPRQEFSQLIEAMLPFSLDDTNLMAKIDLLVAMRLRGPTGAEDGLEVLTYCATLEGFNPVKRLRRCFDHLRGHDLMHGQLLTSWLLNLSIPHSVVRSLLNDCPMGKAPPLDVIQLAGAGGRDKET